MSDRKKQIEEAMRLRWDNADTTGLLEDAFRCGDEREAAEYTNAMYTDSDAYGTGAMRLDAFLAGRKGMVPASEVERAVKEERERIMKEFERKSVNKGVFAEIPKQLFDEILNPEPKRGEE